MNSLRTVSRAIRAPAAAARFGQSATQVRRLTGTGSSEFPESREAAVRDAIMDKLWASGSAQPAASTASSAAASADAPAQPSEAPSEPARL